jgi:hypothetical protein
MTLADLLAAARIDWTAVVEAGGDLDTIAREARAAGDEQLYRRARRAAARR